MAFPNGRVTFSKISPIYCRLLSSPILCSPSRSTIQHVPTPHFSVVARYSSPPPPPPPPPSSSSSSGPKITHDGTRWRPMCLYYTQGKCTKMDDPAHLEKFSHDCSRDLQVNAGDVERKCSQELDFFLVLDLEGKVEILEFPVLIIDAKTLAVIDFFHRFVKPTKMSEQAINKYIEGKYGKFGVDRVWHDTALPFKEVLQQFEAWLTQHHLWGEELGGFLSRAAFVTCGNWDLKTKVPQQCKVSGIKLPPYFREWINLKDIYLNFYGHEATGMISMMRQQGIRLLGSHHLGLDDTKNIARVLQHMLVDGAIMRITARRNPDSQNVDFLFENRIRYSPKRKILLKMIMEETMVPGLFEMGLEGFFWDSMYCTVKSKTWVVGQQGVKEEPRKQILESKRLFFQDAECEIQSFYWSILASRVMAR